MSETAPNPNLCVLASAVDNKAQWNLPPFRRRSFQSLERWSRYTLSFRSAAVLRLDDRPDPRVGQLESVQALVSSPWFTALVVVRGQDVLFERYATDFDRDRLHSIQSITKTTMNLVVGHLVEAGLVDLDARVDAYLPEIGSGYAAATVQDVLDMNVANDYTQDFADPASTYYAFEEAMGWRLPDDASTEARIRPFVAAIRSTDVANHSGVVQYKDANNDVLGWIAERVSGRPLRAWLADVVDAAGLEGRFVCSCDRDGVPVVDGGGALTARDLARYGLLFARRGVGIDGRSVGSSAFVEATLTGGIPWALGDATYRYSNQLETDGRAIGHGGYTGQYLVVDLTSGVVCAFFSVSDEKDGLCDEHFDAIWASLTEIGRLSFG